MRIALVSQEYPPETGHGGIATQTFAKATGLAARGHEVFVVTRSADGVRRERSDRGVTVLRIVGSHDWSHVATEPAQWLVWSVDVAAELAALHRSVQLDLVDVPDYGGEGYVHLVNQAAWSRVPTVVHLHGPIAMLSATIGWPLPGSVLQVVGSHMEQTCLSLADAVISSSECSLRWCAQKYAFDGAKVPILHMGVDTDLFRPFADSPAHARPTIVFAGRLAASKGVEALLEAALTLVDEWPALRLVLIGRGEPDMLARLRGRVAAAGHPDLLDLRGHLSHRELAKQLPHADVFAAPSAYEGGPGLVYLEAMACGLPVIACTGSGAAEVVDSGRTGLLVTPGDQDELVQALRSLLGPQGRALGRAGRRRAVELYDVGERVVRLEEFYQDVVDAAGPQAP